jgi:hypothetical protein
MTFITVVQSLHSRSETEEIHENRTESSPDGRNSVQLF